MTGVRFADVQARPAEFLNLTSLTLEEFEALVAPFEAAFQDESTRNRGRLVVIFTRFSSSKFD